MQVTIIMKSSATERVGINMSSFPVNITVPYVDNIEQRGYADMIEKLVAEEARKNCPDKFHKARSKRSVEDFSYRGSKTTWYDVKSFDVDSDFSMPNLISIDRCRKVLADPNQDLVYILVDYRIDHIKRTVEIVKIEFRAIYEIDPAVLAIQNLGKGVLQVKNMHNSLDKYSEGRYNWSCRVSDMAVKFYEKQIVKFERLKTSWQ